MPQQAWSDKRERQYEHIKEGLLERGESEDRAEEIAARTVNKERARAGEAEESSRLSKTDISSGRRGGLRSHRGRAGRTRDQLY
ncbi:MAG: plasmid stabilization protein, partial [Acidimicrobiia bacterium]